MNFVLQLASIVFVLLAHPVDSTASCPYQLLGVSRTATNNEIRSSYRSLCLKYHPDKNAHRSRKEQIRCDEKFKQVQSAFSKISTARDRKEYDARNFFNNYASEYSSKRRGRDEANNFHPYSFPFHDDEYRSALFKRFHPSNTKSHYVQRDYFSLEDLYAGKAGHVFTVAKNPYAKVQAAFRGGGAWRVLYTRLLTAAFMLRTMNRSLCLAVSTLLAFDDLPEPDATDFIADIKPGYKGGTSISFQDSENVKVTFILKEKKHPYYRRKGDMLLLQRTITRSEAEKGCSVDLPSLSGQKPIQVSVAPKEVSKTGDTKVLHGMGWPNRRTGKKGDLILQFRVLRACQR